MCLVNKKKLEQTKEIMHRGDLYLPNDTNLLIHQTFRLEKLRRFNKTCRLNVFKRTRWCKKMFAEFGDNSYIELPFYSNFAGEHVHIGHDVYANFNLTLVDDTHIYIGDYTMIGPNVIIATAGHPVLPELREKMYQYNAPVHIGRNCWIGAGSIILPGVTIGDNVVIGAGSVVTKDIESNVVAVGNPCKVMRPVGEKDKEFYFKDRKIDIKE